MGALANFEEKPVSDDLGRCSLFSALQLVFASDFFGVVVGAEEEVVFEDAHLDSLE